MSKSGKRAKSLLEQIADISDPQPKDFDIENFGVDDNAYVGSAGAMSDESEDEGLSRKHYIEMGTSTLRQNQGIGDLGPKYVGARVSRRDLYDEQSADSSQDEEAIDSEISDEEDEGDNDEDSDSDSNDELGHGQMFGGDSDDQGEAGSPDNYILDELKKLEEGEKALLKTITQTAQSDVEKGKHVLNQTRMWEGALDARIRVQKLMTAANELPRPSLFPEAVSISSEQTEERLAKAQMSVQQLLNSLIQLRKTLIAKNNAIQQQQQQPSIKVGSKRSAEEGGADIEAVWDDMEQLRSLFRDYRDESLEKWSNRVQVTANIGAAKKFKAVNQGIMHQINQTLATRDRLIERTQLKRIEYHIVGESAPKQDAEKSATVDSHLRDLDAEIFDDTDFYQQLLRELIESRMVDSNDPTATLGTRWAAVKQQTRAKKRNVDTKASKGRKIRYQVMDKLQNFMPPIPAGTWHEDMVNELFSSLLGQSVPQSILDADVDNSADQPKYAVPDSHSKDIVTEIKGLRLFG
ncbi:rRNA-processing protein bfr2 [Coemansia sp. RSA 2599]|nr:rRNA-processing protein bfr2 [Coemansia sp. RSA 2598]KAJ1827563.1 rRNA-processing protein bfr2 [Coemansia sp. RSA 2599]